MFVCCKKPENGCKGVPECQCKCPGCQDEWDRFMGSHAAVVEDDVDGAEEWGDEEE